MSKVLGVKRDSNVTTSAASKADVDSSFGGSSGVSAGVVAMLGTASVPSGWILCDGAEYSQTTYANLYAAIGSSYNTHPTLGAPTAGNFRVPDFRDVFPVAVNSAGNAKANALGVYSTSGWNHTHDVPNHTHTLGNHTHTLNSHTHGVPTHTHTLSSHTHNLPSHTHTYNSHSHSFPAHYHSHALTATISHRHGVQAKNTGTSGGTSVNPRGGNTSSTNTQTVGNATYTASFSGTVGAGSLNDTGLLVLTATSGTTGATASVATGTPSADTAASGALTTSTPSADSGVPSTNTTDSSGVAATGTANPPYFGVHFIIKT
mgnify:FL=1